MASESRYSTIKFIKGSVKGSQSTACESDSYMKDLEDIELKSEMDEIMRSVETIMKRVETVLLTKPEAAERTEE